MNQKSIKMKSIMSLAVFCGSRSGSFEKFSDDAAALGKILAEKSITLIYGGGNKGLMAAVANACMQHGGSVVGVIPKHLTELEHQHNDLTELIISEDMHARKKMLYEKADAALVMAGGFGTLDEMFEILTWNHIRLHNKKIFLLNTLGFYDHLIQHIHKMEEVGFLYGSVDDLLTVINSPEEIFQYL